MNAEMNFKMNNINAHMNSDIHSESERTSPDKKEMGIAENCNFSGYSMFAVAGGILLAIGTVIYSVVAAL